MRSKIEGSIYLDYATKTLKGFITVNIKDRRPKKRKSDPWRIKHRKAARPKKNKTQEGFETWHLLILAVSKTKMTIK